MNWKRVAVILTLNNAVLLMLIGLARPTGAASIPPVLRGRALELVDDHGRLRAEIKVVPAEPALKMPDGTTGYPEAVQLRLFSSQGGPNVKLVALEDGSGLVLGSERAYVQVLSRGGEPFVKIVTKGGREQLLKP
jgi:hypothetical protein